MLTVRNSLEVEQLAGVSLLEALFLRCLSQVGLIAHCRCLCIAAHPLRKRLHNTLPLPVLLPLIWTSTASVAAASSSLSHLPLLA